MVNTMILTWASLVNS